MENQQGSSEMYRAPTTGYQGKGHIIYENTRVFSFTQRLNRLRYCCYGLGSLVFFALLGALGAVLVGATGSKELGQLYVFVVAGLVILWLIYIITLMVRRLHDTERSGLWWLCIFLPFVNLLLSIYLLTAAGTSGMNRFGTPNPDNGPVVSFFGGLVWILSMLQYLLTFAFLVFSLFAPELLQQPWMQDYLDPGMQQQQVEEVIRNLTN